LMWSGLLLSSLPVITIPIYAGWTKFLLLRMVISAWLFGGLCMTAAVVRGIWRLGSRRAGEGAVAL